jgi:Tfp pilus assembly protein PilV
MKKNIKNSGFMVIEMLVAISIITVSILTAMTVAGKSVYISHQALHTTEAGFLLEEGAEAVRIVRDNDWTNISSLSPNTNYYPIFYDNTWTLSTIVPYPIDIFTRTVTIQNVNRNNTTGDIATVGTDDPGTKLITITVSWPEGGTILSKTLQFYLTNIFS